MHMIADAIDRHAERSGARVAVSCGKEETTFRALASRARRLSQVFSQQDVGGQLRVATIGRNNDAFYEVLLGCLEAGAIFTPLNWRLSGPEMAYVLADCEPHLLFVEDEFRTIFSEQLDALGGQIRVVILDATWRERVFAEGPSEPLDARSIQDSDTAWQIYTSGTTGRPKAAEHSFAAAARGVQVGMRAKDLTDADVCLAVLPQFHVGGIMSGIQTLCAGGRVVVVRDPTPSAILSAIERQQATMVFLVPTLISALTAAATERPADTASLRRIYYGGAPMSRSILDRARQAFGCEFVQLYGMTETLGMVSYLDPQDHFSEPALLESAGRPYPEMEVAILSPEGQPLPADTIGEIACRGSFVMKGYWRKPEETRSALVSGWLRTGDIGLLTSAGYLYVRDRLKDMIITGGENVYPAEVENALLTCPSVAEAAVIGLSDERWGEAVAALVVLRAEAMMTEEMLHNYLRSRIAGYKLPKQIRFVATLPKNQAGKISRREIKQAYLEQFAGQPARQSRSEAPLLK